LDRRQLANVLQDAVEGLVSHTGRTRFGNWAIIP
jgi:hypothetical protein